MDTRRRRDTYSVFVGQLGHNITKADLQELFQGCGAIADIVIMEDQNGLRSNFGFVRYYNPESAFRASTELNEWTLKGSRLMVDISKDTMAKIKTENGTVVKKRPLKTAERRETTQSANDKMKDSMYLNRLKDSLTGHNLEYGRDQVNYNRLLKDMGSTSTLCHSTSISLKEHIPIKHVSTKIMERCKGGEYKAVGARREEEFKKGLLIIMSEISAVMDITSLNLDTSIEQKLDSCKEQTNESVKNVKDQGIVEKPIFNPSLVPESVRRIQLLEKYIESKEPAKNQSAESTSKNVAQKDSYSEMCDAECMTDIESEVQVSDKSVQSNEDNETVAANQVLDPAILDYHLSNLNNLNLSAQTHYHRNLSPQNYNIDPLEALYLRDQYNSGVQRSNSRDSSLSEGSNDGNKEDSGVECDLTARMTAQPEQTGMGYEYNRAEGRARPPNIRFTLRSNIRSESERMFSEDSSFSLQEYLSKNMGRGRGEPVSIPKTTTTTTTPGSGRGIFRLQ